MVAYKLKGVVAAYWLSFKEERRHKGQPEILKWYRMKRILRKKFLLEDYKQQLFTKLQNCRQGARCIEEYMTEFYDLLTRNQVTETESQLVSRFLNGLNRIVKNQPVTPVRTTDDNKK
ncbi:hypothetical protein IFM89_017963 [Coptis chinensis]|uniref:Retrotransposon gag domain-containing protein n=1 Tax=Coptis chinensis TaxID=261450 RepID=A0A835LS86_9MAGN|nr:hypothetical protein IFM89_017963 [Coptis chinensis]